jgi:hypothetical protein
MMGFKHHIGGWVEKYDRVFQAVCLGCLAGLSAFHQRSPSLLLIARNTQLRVQGVKQLFLSHPTFFVRRNVYEQYGLFNLSLGTAADYDLMLRLLLRHGITTTCPDQMRTGGVSNASFKTATQTVDVWHGN